VALKLDPLSPIIYTDIGDIYTDLGEPDSAMGMLHKALELDPEFVPALIGLANAYCLKGEYSEAERTARKLVSLDAGPVGDLILAYTLAKAGKREQAAEILDRLLLTGEDPAVDSPDFAAVYLALGAREKAFSWLEKGFDVRAAGMVAVSVDSRFTDVRSDPRFVGLVRRMGLDQKG
jgi:tetratricopeptide (TPR) repeat protein